MAGIIAAACLTVAHANAQTEWGPVTDAEKADVLVEVQQFPTASAVAQKDWPKLNPPDLCQVWLVRMTNRGQLPAAFDSTQGRRRAAAIWLEGEQGQIGLAGSQGTRSGKVAIQRFLGIDIDAATPASAERSRIEKQYKDFVLGFNQYWQGVSLVAPLHSEANVTAVSRELDGRQLLWLDKVLALGPDHPDVKSLVNSHGAFTGPTDQASPLWPGASVWGYVLFQLNAPAPDATVHCDLGKAVTWCVVENADLGDQIMQEVTD